MSSPEAAETKFSYYELNYKEMVDAVTFGDIRRIQGTLGRQLLGPGIAVNPLHVAIQTTNINMVKSLLEGGVNDASTGEYEYNALSLAARAGHPVILKLLLDAGFDPNTPANTVPKTTPICFAAMGPRGEDTAFYVFHRRHKPGFDERNVPYLECIRLLIEAGANVEFKTDLGDSVLFFARHAGNEAAFQIIESEIERRRR